LFFVCYSIDIRTTNFDDEADLVCCPPDKIIQSSPPSNGDKSATCADNPGKRRRLLKRYHIAGKTLLGYYVENFKADNYFEQ